MDRWIKLEKRTVSETNNRRRKKKKFKEDGQKARIKETTHKDGWEEK